jgi:uncharacterized protein (DUF4415 family)
LRFEWDPDKAQSNKRKHGVSFESAADVFADPYAMIEQDRIEGGDIDGRRSAWPPGSRSWWWRTPSPMKSTERKLSASSPPDARDDTRGTAMKKKGFVRYELDLEAPPNPERKAELEALAALPDEQIDTSDIPPLTDAFWRNAARNPFYRPVKKQLTVRLDADVLAWLRAAGRGYQTKLNGILRRAMLDEAVKK